MSTRQSVRRERAFKRGYFAGIATTLTVLLVLVFLVELSAVWRLA